MMAVGEEGHRTVVACVLGVIALLPPWLGSWVLFHVEREESRLAALLITTLYAVFCIGCTAQVLCVRMSKR